MNMNMSGLKELKELREKELRDVREMLSAQALGVVKKWGWKGKETHPMPQTQTETQAESSTAAASTVPDASQPAPGQSRESYLSLRERVRERTGSNAALTPFEHLGAGGTSSDSNRRTSFGSAVSASGSERGRDITASPIQIPRSVHSTSRSSSPHASGSSPSSATSAPIPIHRSQPSIREIPRMTIPGIHSNHKGELMAISSENVSAVISPISPPLKIPPPLPPRRADSLALSSGSSSVVEAKPSTPGDLEKKEEQEPEQESPPLQDQVIPDESSPTPTAPPIEQLPPEPGSSPAKDALKEFVSRDSVRAVVF